MRILGSCFCSLEFAFLDILFLWLVLLLRLDISLFLSSYYWWLGLILFWFLSSVNMLFLWSLLFILGLRRNLYLLFFTLGDLRLNLWRLLFFVLRFLNFCDDCFCLCIRFLVYFFIGFFVSLSCWSCFWNYLCNFLFSFGWALLTCGCLLFNLLLLLLSLFLCVFFVLLFTLYLLEALLFFSSASCLHWLYAVCKLAELCYEETVHVVHMWINALCKLERRVEVLSSVVSQARLSNLETSLNKFDVPIL